MSTMGRWAGCDGSIGWRVRAGLLLNFAVVLGAILRVTPAAELCVVSSTL